MDSNLAFDPASLPEEPIFEIHTTEGTITILLYADTPLHRDNFVKLASRHYYDSVLFHRVIYNFMIHRPATPTPRIPPRRMSTATAVPTTPSPQR